MKAEDYEVVKVIGRGAFGEVQLVSSLPLWPWECIVWPLALLPVSEQSVQAMDSCSCLWLWDV